MEQGKILIIGSTKNVHADCLVSELEERGAPFFRFNMNRFPLFVECDVRVDEKGDISAVISNLHNNTSISSQETKSVLYLPQIGGGFELDDIKSSVVRDFADKESTAVLPLLFEAFSQSFWVNDVTALAQAKNKLLQARIAREIGMRVPETFITTSPETARQVIADFKPRSTALKTLTGVWKMTEDNIISAGSPTRKVEEEDITPHNIPMVLQEYVEKDVELRITVVGTRVFATEIHSQESPNEATRMDWRVHDFAHVPYQTHNLPTLVENQCRQLLDKLGLVYGAIDMILTPEGEYIFLEVNPDGVWHWIEVLTGMPIASAFADMLVKGEMS